MKAKIIHHQSGLAEVDTEEGIIILTDAELVKILRRGRPRTELLEQACRRTLLQRILAPWIAKAAIRAEARKLLDAAASLEEQEHE